MEIYIWNSPNSAYQNMVRVQQAGPVESPTKWRSAAYPADWRDMRDMLFLSLFHILEKTYL
jgi:hypothetical protein